MKKRRHHSPHTQDLIDTYGDQAYWKAVDLICINVKAEYLIDAQEYVNAAIELIHKGYHKRGERPKDKGQA